VNLVSEVNVAGIRKGIESSWSWDGAADTGAWLESGKELKEDIFIVDILDEWHNWNPERN